VIVVIGATGTVGTEVVRQLAAAGQRPRALVRDLEAARQRLGGQVEAAAGDDIHQLTGRPPRTLTEFLRDFAVAFQPLQAP
jgi:uncharacterized protein YbjT (DUF2867 family)